MLHRTRSLLVLVVALAFLVTACVPPEFGAVSFGCSRVQGSITLPGVVPPPPIPISIEVQDMDGRVLGSASMQLVPAGPASTTVSVDIPLNPAQADGTFLLMVMAAGGSNMPLGGAACTGEPEPTFFNPGDGRVDPRPGDRLAIYCNQPPGSLDVWGVDDDSKGFRLATFTFDELTAAGPGGVYTTVDPNGTISVSADEQGNFWAAWNGGVHNADGQPDHGFAKGFRCD